MDYSHRCPKRTQGRCHHWRRCIRVMVPVLLAVVAHFSVAPSLLAQEIRPAQTEAISQVLAAQLATGDDVPMLVVLDAQLPPADALARAAVAASTDRTARGAALYRELTAHAQASQADLRAWLDAQGIAYRPFYIVNMIRVVGDAELAVALAQHPHVARLEADPAVRHSLAHRSAHTLADMRRLYHRPAQSTDGTALPWGLTNTQADQVWARGYTGQGMVVASQDTGVEWDHPALQTRYRGWDAATTTADHRYNWFDAWGSDGRPARCDPDPQIPCDDDGHGTHTVGTMAGQAAGLQPRLGMAPDATWIGCRNMRNGLGTPSSYTACFEFFLAPYPQGGDPFTDGDPALAPHIVNNSWSCPDFEGCDESSLRQVVETVRAAGIFVIAAAGNGGPSCSSVDLPIALHDATFSVGAYNQSNVLATFSSRGPVTVDGSGRLKPDISAPGVGVYSAYTNGGYVGLQGTSMASPHVAGAAALLWSAAPALIGQIDLSEQVLIKSATEVPTSACTADGVAVSPNGLYGYGQLNALTAVEMALHPAQLQVDVRSCQGTPVPGATVTVTDQSTDYDYRDITSGSGLALLTPLYARAGGDPFMVTASVADGAGPVTYAGRAITLTAGVTQTLTLTPDNCLPDRQLGLVLQSADPVRSGRPVSFTVFMTNTGATLWNAYPLTVTFAPEYLAYTAAEPNATSTDAATGSLTWSAPSAHGAELDAGALQAGESLSVTVEFLAVRDTTMLPDSATTAVASTSGFTAQADVRIFAPASALIANAGIDLQGADVILRWASESEMFIRAYELLGMDDAGKPTSLFAGPFVAVQSGNPAGAAYRFVDPTRPATPYARYVLLVYDRDGAITLVPLGRNPVYRQLFIPLVGIAGDP